MRRTPTPELDKVFTYAESSYATDAPDLVFSSLQKNEDILSEDILLEIARDPRTREVLGVPFVVMGFEATYPNIIVSADFEYVIELIEHAPLNRIIVLGHDKGTSVIKPGQIFDNCHLPHKYIVGCKECISDRETEGHCLPKEAVLEYGRDEHTDCPLDVDDLEEWKHRGFSIGGFTYISPMLTAPKNIAQRKRPIKEHDFSYVSTRSEIRSDALKERYRRERFRKNECSRCLTKEKCLAYQNRSSWAGCEGPYLYTEEEAENRVLECTTIPFTNPQFVYLLKNSGALPRLVNRRKCVTSFYLEGTTLRFGRQYVTDPYSHLDSFDSFKEAKSFIKEYGHDRDVFSPQSWSRKRVKHLKAMVSLLAQFDSSPWRSVMFHGSLSFPASHISLNYGSVEQHYTMSRGRRYWYTRQIDKVADLARYDWDIPHLSRTTVPDGYKSRY
jgi:hypothetical protein